MTDPLVEFLRGAGGVQQPENVIVFPNNAGTGSSRIVVGADIPNELKTYSGFATLAAAIFFYDVIAGVEVGYHFIAEGKSIFTNEPVTIHGKVTYPIPGNPSSPTNLDVTLLQDWGTTQTTIYQQLNINSTGRMYYSNAFTPMPIMDCGSQTVAIPNGSTNVLLGPFNFSYVMPSVPVVTCQLFSGSGQAVEATVLLTAVSQASFSCRFIKPTATTAAFNPVINWQAATI